MKIEEGTKVKVISGKKMFEGVIEKTEWDFDQWCYFIDGEWYCQSEVNVLRSAFFNNTERER